MTAHDRRLAQLRALAAGCKATTLILEALSEESKGETPICPAFVGTCTHSSHFRPDALPKELADEAKLDTIRTLGEAYQRAIEYASSFHGEVASAIKKVRKQPTTSKKLERTFEHKTRVLVVALLGVIISHDGHADSSPQLVRTINLFTEVWEP